MAHLETPVVPTISCVVCTYRRTDTLGAAIGSLLKQTLPWDAYEIIVVDNNSGDETPDIVRSHAQTCSNIRYVLETKPGLSHARNAGVGAARTEIIAFLDDDAEAAPEWLMDLAGVFRRHNDAWAAGGKVLPIWDAPSPDWLDESYHRSLSLVDWGEQERPLTWPERLIGTNVAFRRAVFAQAGLFVPELGRIGQGMLGNEDTEIQERIHASGHQVYFSPRAVVYHHVPASRLQKQYFLRRALGSGRSQAILTARTEGRRGVLRKMLTTSVRLSRGLIRTAYALIRLGPIIRFKRGIGHAYEYGLIAESIKILLGVGWSGGREARSAPPASGDEAR